MNDRKLIRFMIIVGLVIPFLYCMLNSHRNDDVGQAMFFGLIVVIIFWKGCNFFNTTSKIKLETQQVKSFVGFLKLARDKKNKLTKSS